MDQPTQMIVSSMLTFLWEEISPPSSEVMVNLSFFLWNGGKLSIQPFIILAIAKSNLVVANSKFNPFLLRKVIYLIVMKSDPDIQNRDRIPETTNASHQVTSPE